MARRAAVLVCTVTLTLVILAPSVVRACSCARTKPVSEGLTQADAVFVGETTAVERADSWWGIAVVTLRSLWAEFRVQGDSYVHAWERSARYGRVAQFRVLKQFKGAPELSASIHTGFGSGDCGYQFSVGTEYLVYAHVKTDTIDPTKQYLTTSICSRTGPVRDASDEMAELQRLTQVSER